MSDITTLETVVGVTRTAQIEFGERLRMLREERHLSLRDAASQMGVGASTVLRLERGDGDPAVLKALAWMRQDDYEAEHWRLRALRAEQALRSVQTSVRHYDEQMAADPVPDLPEPAHVAAARDRPAPEGL